MSMIKSTITNAADITILTLIDNTYRTIRGNNSIAACVVEAPKGPVGRVLNVHGENWRDILGKPFHAREGIKSEGLRHLNEAAEACESVQVVRVVAEDAEFPSIGFNSTGAAEPITKSSHKYGTTVESDTGVAITVYPKDGDPSTKRKISITNVDTEKERITLEVTEQDSLGADQLVERLTFSFDPDAVDDMGAPAYVESVFENFSTRLDVSVGPDASIADFAVTGPEAFEGGTNGGVPTTEDYKKAWNAFRDMRVDLNFMFAAGNYDVDVLANCIEIAEGRHAQFFFDAPAQLGNDAAVNWLSNAALQSRQANCYHGAFSFQDPFYGGRAVWGYSGAVAAARARGNANFAGNVPGVHYAAAGTKRGGINRRGARALYATDPLDKDAFYTARINPILANETGPGVVIGDDLAIHFQENYSRFGWVNSITNYIVHRFMQAAAFAKFEPDGLTRDILTDLTTEMMEELVTAGALVRPRDDANGGNRPYVIKVEQVEIDLWKVTWEVCPTGAARRIAGQPKLIK
ncbi:hypothetical protein [Vreelandella alkaliphila]|uniref:Uncharacterized protein n=1 Tax=Vreelandella alkaliphila TaxID=272774 RepID=A0AAJ2S0S2_9GAMM|nr:hypothetical protein [Halomonas alkaliphila]MDX5979646.1 hypothetical protein [Halomonas alkaliphila]